MSRGREPIEYQSPQKWRNWPVVHVSLGGIGAEGRYVRGQARGLIAVGDSAMGLIAVGGVARGLIAVGMVAVGAVACGAIGVGLVALAGLAIGLVCAGGGSVGVFPHGGGAIPLLDLPWYWGLVALVAFGSVVGVASMALNYWHRQSAA